MAESHSASDRRRLGALVAIALGATALRMHHIAYFPLSGDEAFTAVLANRGLPAIFAATTAGDPHPPLFYAALVAWTRVAGDSELALRYVGLMTGVLLIPLTWWLGRRLVGSIGATVAAVWLAAHPYQVWYAHEARMYLPTALVAALASACLWRWLERPTTGRLVAYIAAAGTTMYTHYYGTLLVACQSLFVVGLWFWRRRLGEQTEGGRLPARPWLLGQVALATLYAPWLVTASRMIGTYNSLGWGGPIPALKETLVRFTVGHTWEWDGSAAVGGAVAAIAAVGALAVARGQPSWLPRPAAGAVVGKRQAGLYVVGWALAPGVVGFALSLARPMYTPRYLMVSAVAIALLVGAGVTAGWRWRRPAGVLFCTMSLVPGLVALYNLYYQPTYARSGYDRLGSYLLAHGRPGQAIVLAGWTQQDMFWYYYQRRTPEPLPSYFFPRSDPIDPAATAEQLDNILRQYDGIWYVETDTQRYDPQKVMERHLTTSDYKAFERWFLVNRLVYYQSANLPTELAPAGPARFGEAIGITRAAVGPSSVRPGEIVAVEVEWQALARLDRDLKVSLLLRDPDGHTVASVDREPSDGFTRTSSWQVGAPVRDRIGIVVPSTVPTGTYRLGLKMYDPATGATLPPRADGRVDGDVLALGNVRVDGEPVRSVGDYAPAVRTDVSLAGAQLVGFDPVEGVDAKPGETIDARVYFRLTGAQPPMATVEFVEESGRIIGAQNVALAPAWSTASSWETGRVYTVYLGLKVPARARSGVLTAQLRAGDLRVPARLFSVRVTVPERSFVAPAFEHSVDARFGAIALLAGYDGPPPGAMTAKPGETVRVRLHWRALGETEVSFKLFVHLVGPDGQIHGQTDTPPLAGQRPTAGWVDGEWITDPITVTLPTDAPEGAYVLRLGFYDERTGRRLPVDGTGRDYVDLLGFAVSR